MIVVMALDQGSIPRFVERVTTILDAMSANVATFPAPTPTLTKVHADLSALVAAQSALKTHTGPRTDRDAAVQVVVSDMSQLRAYVEAIVNASPREEAEVIAGQAAMTLKRKTAFSKPPLDIKPLVSGSLKLVAKAHPGAGAYDWQVTHDGGATWFELPSTVQATTTVHGLVPATTVSFRMRALLRKGPGDWGSPVSTLVL